MEIFFFLSSHKTQTLAYANKFKIKQINKMACASLIIKKKTKNLKYKLHTFPLVQWLFLIKKATIWNSAFFDNLGVEQKKKHKKRIEEKRKEEENIICWISNYDTTISFLK